MPGAILPVWTLEKFMSVSTSAAHATGLAQRNHEDRWQPFFQMNAVSSAPASAQRRSLKRQVFVVEDHMLMRRSIVEAIEREPDLAVCGQAEDAGEALPEILSLRPDLVLTDIQLKSSSGLDLIKALGAQSPAIPVVATTMFNVNQNKRLANKAGAAGFVSKQDGPDRMVAVIREVLQTGAGEEPQENT